MQQVNMQYSRIEVSQQQIIYNDDTMAIFTDVMPLLRTIYAHYFDLDLSAKKGMVK
jgi:hypothetical protein